jgi:hypothetical protein
MCRRFASRRWLAVQLAASGRAAFAPVCDAGRAGILLTGASQRRVLARRMAWFA